MSRLDLLQDVVINNPSRNMQCPLIRDSALCHIGFAKIIPVADWHCQKYRADCNETGCSIWFIPEGVECLD